MPAQNQTSRIEIAELRGCLRKLEATVDLKFSSRDESLRLQAKEYERRLETLNNENARILAAGAKSVDSSYFEARMNAVIDRVMVIEKKLVEQGGLHEGGVTLKNNLIALVALVAAVVSIYMTLRGGR